MPWAGTKTDMTVVSGDLQLDAGAEEGSYLIADGGANPYVDTGTVGRYRINLQFDAKESGGVIADDSNEIEVKLEIDLATAAGPTWLGWRPYKPGEYYCRWYRIRATVKVDDAFGNRPLFFRFEHNHVRIGSVPVSCSIDELMTAPTGSEPQGTRYIVIATATGDFAGKEDQLAELLETTDRTWEFSIPVDRQEVYNLNDGWKYRYEGSFPGGSWVPRGLNVSNPEKDKFVGAMTVVGAKGQEWDTDGGGDIGQSGAKRPDNVHAKTGMTIGGVAVVSGAHASTHEDGGSDEIDVGGLSGLLADDQNPTGHASDHENGGGDEINVAGLSGELADDQPPKAHAADHQNGGGDEISVAGLSGQLADDQPALAHALGGAKHSADTLANLNTKVSDATLDDSGDSRPGACPIGGIIAWHKSFPNTPALPAQYVECNGQTLSDGDSPYDGQVIPDLNGGARFLRGSATSGANQVEGTKSPTIPFEESPGPWTMDNAVGGATRRNIAYTLQGVGGNEVTFGGGGDAETRPINMSVVWVMRIK